MSCVMAVLSSVNFQVTYNKDLCPNTGDLMKQINLGVYMRPPKQVMTYNYPGIHMAACFPWAVGWEV